MDKIKKVVKMLVISIVVIIIYSNFIGHNNNKKVYAEDDGVFARPTWGSFTSPYGPRTHPVTGEKGKMHHGIDIANAIGTPIHAIYDGVVWKVETSPTGGNMLYINHTVKGKKFTSGYLHLDEPGAKEGTKVKKGDIVGKMGNTGIGTGSHLHFEIHEGGRSPNFYGNDVDPMKYYEDKNFSKENLTKGGKDVTGVSGGSKDESKDDKTNTESKGSSNSDGEYTGNLEFNPFIKGKVVQNTTGIDKKDSNLGHNEAYMVMVFFTKVITFVLKLILVISAIYLIIISMIILGIAIDTPLILENKILRRLAGEEFIDKLRGDGIAGSLKILAKNFGIPLLLLTIATIGQVQLIQYLLFSTVLEFVEKAIF